MAHTILFLHSSAGLYGADRQLLTLAGGLERARFTPVVVLPEPGPLAPLLERADVKVEFQPLAVLRRTLASPGGAASTAARVARDRMALGRLVKRHGAALIHSNTSVVLAGGPAARRAGIPHVVHVREIYEGAGAKGAEALWPKLRNRLQDADALVCISEAVAAQFPRATGVHVIRDCLAREPHTSVGAVVRRAMKIEPDAFLVALIGRISDWKGQDVLARAMAEPALAEIGAVALVVGDAYPGHERDAEDVAALAEQLELGERFRMCGFRDDVGTVLGACDAVVIPSVRPEPLGQVALEAAWAGVPVVASAHGGLPEIVRDGETGILVPPGDHEALARALRELADDRERAKALGEAGSRAVRDAPGCGQMLAEIQALYEQLAPVPKRRGL